MQIPIDDKALVAVVQQAIFQSLTPETRNLLVQKAIEHLLTQDSSGGSAWNRRSPLQEAWNHAIEAVARKEIVALVEADATIKAKIKELFSAAMDRVLKDPEGVIEGISKAISEGFRFKERY